MIGDPPSTFFADRAWHGTVSVIDNTRIARDTWRVRLDCPPIAERIVPGQFIMLRLTGCDDPLLGRPLALYDTALDETGRAVSLDVVYLVAGKLTSRLARFKPLQEVDVWGPLGNGFSPRPVGHLLLVAGGIGQTPFLALAQECLAGRAYGESQRLGWHAHASVGMPLGAGQSPPRVTLCYGARSADLLAGVDDFRRLGVEVLISTDDGTAGHHGLVTDLLEQALDRAGRVAIDKDRMNHLDNLLIVCCGPEPMMHAVAKIAKSRGVPCEVSLETPMACGIGICFSCVAKVRDAAGKWDYRRTCVEGPVFPAELIEF